MKNKMKFLTVLFAVVVSFFSAQKIYAVVCNCNSCSDCQTKLNDPSCSTVYVTQDIVSSGFPACIENPKKPFNCQNHVISKGSSATSGIYINQNNISANISSCRITGFTDGMLIMGSGGNSFTNIYTYNNTGTGINLRSSGTDNNNFNSIYTYNNGPGGSNGTGISIFNAGNNNIFNDIHAYNHLGSAGNGIVIQGIGSQNSFNLVEIYNNYDGLVLQNVNNTLFNSVNAYSNTYGLQVNSSTGNTFTGSSFSNNTGTGMIVNTSNNNTFNSITANNNVNGMTIQSSSGNYLSGNTLCDNTQYDIWQQSNTNNSGSGNTCDPSKNVALFPSNWNDSGYTGCSSTCTKVCTGAIPTNATLCSGDSTGLTANAANTVVAACGAPKCEYTCNAGYVKSGNSCIPASYTCTGTPPTNATLCSGDNTGLTANTPYSVVTTCGVPKCEYTCNAGYYNNAGTCVAYSCTGTNPANATLCANDNTGLTANVPKTAVASCSAPAGSAPKCEYACNAGYALAGGVCQPILIDSSSCVSVTGVPVSITFGQTFPVTITMKNDGTSTWTTAANYKLGSQSPENNLNWGINRIALPSNVTPDSNAVFTATFTAPSLSGTYDFQWQMLIEGVKWFGNPCPGTPTSVIVNPATYACTGLPANATACNPTGINLTSDKAYGIISSSSVCTAGGVDLCEAYCNSGYALSGGICVPTLTIAITGSGTVANSVLGINCESSTCAYPFVAGTEIDLKASEASGSTFDSWNGCTPGGITYPSNQTCSLTMPANPKTVDVKFNAACTPSTCNPSSICKGQSVSIGCGMTCDGIKECSTNWKEVPTN